MSFYNSSLDVDSPRLINQRTSFSRVSKLWKLTQWLHKTKQLDFPGGSTVILRCPHPSTSLGFFCPLLLPSWLPHPVCQTPENFSLPQTDQPKLSSPRPEEHGLQWIRVVCRGRHRDHLPAAGQAVRASEKNSRSTICPDSTFVQIRKGCSLLPPE